MKKLVFWQFAMFLLVLAVYFVAGKFLPAKEIAAVAFGVTSVTLLLLLMWHRNAASMFPAFMASIATFTAWAELSGIIAFFYTAVVIAVGVMLVGLWTRNTLKLGSYSVDASLFVEAALIFWIFPH